MITPGPMALTVVRSSGTGERSAGNAGRVLRRHSQSEPLLDPFTMRRQFESETVYTPFADRVWAGA